MFAKASRVALHFVQQQPTDLIDAMRYRRSIVEGGMWFFTVNLADRGSHLLIEQIDILRDATRKVKECHPFDIVAMVIMPEHLHAIWQLPPNDGNYAMRWSLLKSNFSRQIDKEETVSRSREARRERGIWQRRYWEHQIRDDEDLATHVDYIHHNPVKHGYVKRAADWPHSSIHRYIKEGLLDENWGYAPEDDTGKFGER